MPSTDNSYSVLTRTELYCIVNYLANCMFLHGQKYSE